MGKRKRKKRRAKHPAAPKAPALAHKGFDFGIPVYHLAAGSPEVAELLNRADIVGCAIGERWSPELGARIPFVALVGRAAGPLREAFEILNKWSVYPGDDAVSLSFILFKTDGYLVTLGPDWHALRQRTLRYGRAAKAIGFMVTWIHHFDASDGGTARQLREYRANSPLSPFYLTCALTSATSAVDHFLTELRPVDDSLDILKFQVELADEDVLGSDDPLAQVVRAYRERRINKDKLSSRPNLGSREIAGHRRHMLKTHFPVTSMRIDRLEYVSRLRLASNAPDLRRWQVVQAFGNLQLSNKLLHVPHYETIGAKNLDSQVVTGLDDWYESADENTDQLAFFSTEVILRQIVLDSVHLLSSRRLGVIPSTVAESVAALARAGLLTED